MGGVSPWNGRHIVAHGVSHGSMSPAHTPSPLSRCGGRGGTQGGKGHNPRANAMGYNISPLSGAMTLPCPREEICQRISDCGHFQKLNNTRGDAEAQRKQKRRAFA